MDIYQPLNWLIIPYSYKFLRVLIFAHSGCATFIKVLRGLIFAHLLSARIISDKFSCMCEFAQKLIREKIYTNKVMNDQGLHSPQETHLPYIIIL